MAERHGNQRLEVKQKVVGRVERKEVVELPVAAKSLVAKKVFFAVERDIWVAIREALFVATKFLIVMT